MMLGTLFHLVLGEAEALLRDHKQGERTRLLPHASGETGEKINHHWHAGQGLTGRSAQATGGCWAWRGITLPSQVQGLSLLMESSGQEGNVLGHRQSCLGTEN